MELPALAHGVAAPADPAESAKAAGLRYVTDEMPGIRRKLNGGHFEFFDPHGKRISDEDEIARIRALAVPPAYDDVWICPLPNGHLQATGRDARGRKQYRYHKRWREVRDETKYERMIDFAKALPKIRKTIEQHLNLPGLPREKVLATVVQLLETTLIRVGNEEYAKANNSFGLTTLKSRHVKISGSSVRFTFKGKSGIRHAIGLQDRRLAKIVRACRDIPGQNLFQYEDDDGNPQTIDSGDVNAYIREISGEDFTAKDFRTWVGTVSCATLLAALPPIEGASDLKSNVRGVIDSVARRLGNTAAVCRKCYVHPAVIDDYLRAGHLKPLPTSGAHARNGTRSGLHREEKAVLRLLEKATGA